MRLDTHMLSFIITITICVNVCPAVATFLVTDYPNPLNKATLWKCGITSVGPLCDPDSLLNDTARAEALELFKQFKDQTDIDNNDDTNNCKSQGVIVGLALTKQPITARNSRINVTDDLMKNIWQLDNRCNKALMLTLSVQPTPVVRFTRYMTTPVFDDELHHLIWTEMHWLRERNYIMWIRLLLDGLRAQIVDRHGTLFSQQAAAQTNNKNLASHGFVIFWMLIAVCCSVAGTLCAPWLWHECRARFGPIIGQKTMPPFPMVRFNNERENGGTPYTANQNGHQQQQQQQY